MFSAAHLENLGSKFKTAIGLRGRGESAFGMFATSAVEGAVTFGAAYANGRFAEPGKQAVEFGGIPADLLAGGLLQAGALFGFFGRWDDAAHLVGNGLSNVYLARMGNLMGVNHRVAESVASNAPAARGFFGTGALGSGAPALYPTMGVQGNFAQPQAVAGAWGAV